MKIVFHRHFAKRYAKLRAGERHRCDVRLKLFASDTFNPLLDNHALHGVFVGCRSINIGGDLRALYEPTSGGEALFMHLGTHSELYDE